MITKQEDNKKTPLTLYNRGEEKTKTSKDDYLPIFNNNYYVVTLSHSHCPRWKQKLTLVLPVISTDTVHISFVFFLEKQQSPFHYYTSSRIIAWLNQGMERYTDSRQSCIHMHTEQNRTQKRGLLCSMLCSLITTWYPVDVVVVCYKSTMYVGHDSCSEGRK